MQQSDTTVKDMQGGRFFSNVSIVYSSEQNKQRKRKRLIISSSN